MAVRVVVFLLCFILSSVSSFSIIARPFSSKTDGLFKNVFANLQQIFEDLPLKSQTNETGGRGDVLSEPRNVFESNKLVPLQNGGEKIEKLIEKEYFDATGLSKRDVTKELTELYKFPNHTFRMVRHFGMNMTERKEQKIDCIVNEDCNQTSYCLKDTYKCQFCHEKDEPCAQSFQCCPGNICDTVENVCKTNEKIPHKCLNVSECPDDHCCAINEDGEGVCQPYLKEGEDCSVDPFEEFFSLNNRRELFNSYLPNRCSCSPALNCKKHMSLFFFQYETCVKLPNTGNPHKKLSRNSWRFHDDEDLNSLPIPDFPGIQSSISGMLKKVNADSDENVITTTTTKPPKLRHVKNEQRQLQQRLSDVFNENKKIRFNPSALSLDFQQPRPVKSSVFSRRRDSTKTSDSDEEDIIGYSADNNDLLDALNDDNDDSDNDDSDDYDIIKKDQEQLLTEKINKNARLATHKIVDGIFDNIMNAVHSMGREK